jgi:AraC family transcriptional regulator
MAWSAASTRRSCGPCTSNSPEARPPAPLAGIPESDDARRRALRAEYMGRINRVIDHIDANLGGDLPLSTLASVAAFSPFHFHRIFKAVVGETVTGFIRRRRVERAAYLLLANPSRPITQVALECGFSSPAAFARVFRESFGTSATEWLRAAKRSRNGQVDSKQRQAESKSREATSAAVRILDPVTGSWIWRLAMDMSEMKVEVKHVPEMHVAYLRHIGPYAGDGALFDRLFKRLFTWAGPRGLVGPQTIPVSVYDDDPDITDETKLRVDIAITVPAGTNTDGEVGTRTLPAGTYAVAHVEILQHQFTEAWDLLMGRWLPESGYQAGDGPCFELYLNEPDQHPEGRHIVDLYQPVKPL